jgi:hypothetical protein
VYCINTGGWTADPRAGGTRAGSAAATGSVQLKKCKSVPVAPCIQSVVTANGSTTAHLVLPPNERFTVEGGSLQQTIKRLSSSSGMPGSTLTVSGANLASVSSVVIGGAQATVVQHTATKLTVTVPATARTGSVTLTGPAGSVTSTTQFTVLPGPAALTVTPAAVTVSANAAGKFAASGIDSSGLSVGSVTSAATFTIAPDGSGSATGATCAKNACRAAQPGTYTVTAVDGTATGSAILTVT